MMSTNTSVRNHLILPTEQNMPTDTPTGAQNTVQNSDPLFGYVRVSKKKQTYKTQLFAFERMGLEIPKKNIYKDVIGGARAEEGEGWQELYKALSKSWKPTLYVWRVDRLFRHTLKCLQMVDWIVHDLEGTFHAVDQGIIINNESNGDAWFRLELEAMLAAKENRDRTGRIQARLDHKKAQGEKLGRNSVVDNKMRSTIINLSHEGWNNTQIGLHVGISRTTVARVLKDAYTEHNTSLDV